MPDPLPLDFAGPLAATASRRGAFGRSLHYFTEIDSTNDYAAGLAAAGAVEGTTIVASAQTAGRGRFGRSWFSPPGAGLYVSVVVRNRRAAPLLTLAGAVAVADGIRNATGLPVEIKWPNDIVFGDSSRRRKLAGILAEGTSNSSGLQHVVLGFGINVKAAAYPPELLERATSLETETGRAVDAGHVLAESLAELASQVARLAAGDSETVLQRWTLLAPSAHGADVAWETPAGLRSGRTAGIDSDGALLVRRGTHQERIISGTVRWL